MESWPSRSLSETTIVLGIILDPDAIVLLSGLTESYEGGLGTIHTVDSLRAVSLLFVTRDTQPMAEAFLLSLHWVTPLPLSELMQVPLPYGLTETAVTR